ncbi:hypothetical protein ACIXMM_11885 [Bacteroides fragilis]
MTRISLPINDSTVNYTIAWLTHAGVLLFVGTFVGGLIQGAKVKELFIVLWNTVKQLKKHSLPLSAWWVYLPLWIRQA